MKLDRNQLAYVEPVCNSIYTSPGHNKSCFYVEPFKNQKSVAVSMNKVSIPNLYVKVWTRKS